MEYKGENQNNQTLNNPRNNRMLINSSKGREVNPVENGTNKDNYKVNVNSNIVSFNQITHFFFCSEVAFHCYYFSKLSL